MAMHVLVREQIGKRDRKKNWRKKKKLRTQLPPLLLSAIDKISNNTTTTTSSSTTTLFASLFSSASASASSQSTNYTNLIGSLNRLEATSLCLSTNHMLPPQQFSAPPPPLPHLSATALLQKAAQIGVAATSSSSFLIGLGLATTSSSSQFDTWTNHGATNSQSLFLDHGMLGLGLLPCENGAGLPGLMFGAKPTTLDLLGLDIGLSRALMDGMGGKLDVGSGNSVGPTWDAADRESSFL